MIKLIAVDMDGTFLNSQSKYNEVRFKEIHSKLDEKGIHFVVASGNQYYQLKDFFTDYDDIDYVAENGALIRNPEKVYAVHSYPTEAVKAIEKFLLDQVPNLNFLVCGEQAAYGLDILPEKYFKMSSHYYHHLEKIKSFSDIHDKILKFAVQCPDEKTDYFVQLFKDNLSQYSGVTSSGHRDIDIIQPDIHKANGLKELGDILGIKLSEMCAFGDGGNDLEMLREVGDGVAMKNAVPALLEVANHVTDTNDEEGVLNYIEKNIL